MLNKHLMVPVNVVVIVLLAAAFIFAALGLLGPGGICLGFGGCMLAGPYLQTYSMDNGYDEGGDVVVNEGDFSSDIVL